ncbi:SHOCT domain-containing protein [Plantibacter flavus]|uniref:hypothetical protein n=1 Tax=Plantibacter flavus TaxID=150123 RepID=UPI003F15D306
MTTLIESGAAALQSTAGTLAAHPGWYGGPGPHVWLLLLIPVFWILVIVLVVSLVGRRWRRRAWAGAGAPGQAGGPWAWRGDAVRGAEQTLAERFAQGDIDEVEYRARLEVLRANREVPPGR